LTEIEPFPLTSFPGYRVSGHRGHGGDFPTGTAPQIFTFRRNPLYTLEEEVKEPYKAIQAPSYVHEVQFEYLYVPICICLYIHMYLDICVNLRISHCTIAKL
jgi:hypothetical protein